MLSKGDDIPGAEYRGVCETFENTMSAGVVLGATQRAWSAHAGEGRVSRKVSMKIIPQVVQILLLHDRGMYNGWWRAGEINPAKITPDSIEMLQQLAGVNRRGNRKSQGAEGFSMSKGRRVNRRLFAIILAGIKSGDGEAKKSHMFHRDVGNSAQRLTLAAKRSKLVRSVIKYVAMGRSRVRVNLI